MKYLAKLIWGIFTVGGSIWLYGWQHWSGWWVVLGLIVGCMKVNNITLFGFNSEKKL